MWVLGRAAIALNHRATPLLFILSCALFSLPQTLLDMVENYPTALRSLVLAENSISPELQQQICDLLSEGEEEEEGAGGAVDTQEWGRGREPAPHQRGGSSWMCPSGKNLENE